MSGEDATQLNELERKKAQNNDHSVRMKREVHGVGVEVGLFGNELEAERIYARLSEELERMQEADNE